MSSANKSSYWKAILNKKSQTNKRISDIIKWVAELCTTVVVSSIVS